MRMAKTFAPVLLLMIMKMMKMSSIKLSLKDDDTGEHRKGTSGRHCFRK